jgi:hypothetical protein
VFIHGNVVLLLDQSRNESHGSFILSVVPTCGGIGDRIWLAKRTQVENIHGKSSLSGRSRFHIQTVDTRPLG